MDRGCRSASAAIGSRATGMTSSGTTGFRQCLVIVTDKIGSQSPDIVSQIDVFRKPSNAAIGFRERGAALEHQVLAKF